MKEYLKEFAISLAVGVGFILFYSQAVFDWVGNLINYYGGLV